MRCKALWATLAAAIVADNAVLAIDLDLSSPDSIKAAASTIAKELVSIYKGNEPGNTPGLLPEPYYWFEAGMMFDSLIEYWHYTGDSTYNDLVKQGLLFQVGENNNFMPANQSRSMGNDDIAMWALAAMSAAEYGFDQPSKSQPQWLDLAKNVFDNLVLRWDTETCDGGLRWQLYNYNVGYNFKNSASTGAFFELSSRLARYTNNATYSNWAGKTWDWMSKVGLVNEKYQVFQGVDVSSDCSKINHIQFTMPSALLLSGAANMYNSTKGGKDWKSRVEGLLSAEKAFFENDIMTESACESAGTCDIDQTVYKAVFSRALGITLVVAPFTKVTVTPKLEASAKAAVSHCQSDNGSVSCALSWLADGRKNDKSTRRSDDGADDPGVGEKMSALQVIQANLANFVSGPGTSSAPSTPTKEDSNGGSSTSTESSASPTTSDSGAAALISKNEATLFFLVGLFALLG